MSFTIRDATSADLPAILELMAQDAMSHSLEALPLTAEHERALDEIRAHPDHRIVVAELNGEVAGTMQISYLPGIGFGGQWRAQLEAVRVRRELRSRGIGGQMMQWAIEQARMRGCFLVQLTTNRARTDAQRFYERLGFKGTHVGMKLYL
jgi:GNAT superfamily N-acetyltransferase